MEHHGSGVARKLSSAMWGSGAPLSNPLTVFTALSTIPLLCGYLGLLVRWWNPYCDANCLKKMQLNWGPLLDINTDGIPCLPKIDLRALTVAAEVVVRSWITSGYLE